MPLVKTDKDYKTKRRIAELQKHIKYGDRKKLAESLNVTRQATNHRTGNPDRLDVEFLEKLFAVTDWTDEEIIKFVKGNY